VPLCLGGGKCKLTQWEWTSSSNQKTDAGLNGKSGRFTAEEWTEKEKQENPNRRGFVRATPNGHALQYADGSPFFMVGDTMPARSYFHKNKMIGLT
jgi:hypothetical protein